MPGARSQAAQAVTDVVDLIAGDCAQIRELPARISQLTGTGQDTPGQTPGAAAAY